MEITDMENLIKASGCTLILRIRRKTGKQYVYASKRVGPKIHEIYLFPVSKIPEVTPEQVSAKLTLLLAKK